MLSIDFRRIGLCALNIVVGMLPIAAYVSTREPATVQACGQGCRGMQAGVDCNSCADAGYGAINCPTFPNAIAVPGDSAFTLQCKVSNTGRCGGRPGCRNETQIQGAWTCSFDDTNGKFTLYECCKDTL